MMHLSLFVVLLRIYQTLAASIENCGSDGDLMSDVTISLSPDPPKANKDFTVTTTGNLGTTVTSGSLSAHLTITALGQKFQVAATTAFAISPGIAAGAQLMKMGPFKYPHLPLGLKPIVAGNLTFTNSDGKQITCTKFNNFPLFTEEATPVDTRRMVQVQADPVSICNGPNDHLKNIKFSDNNGILIVNGTLDEDISNAELVLDMKISISLLADISITLDIDSPLVYNPGLKSGFLNVQIGPSRYETTLPEGLLAGPSVTAKGSIKLNDGNKQEVLCLDIDIEPTA